MRLGQALEVSGASNSSYDSNNLNSIFYEHMAVALRRALPDALKRVYS